MSDFNDQIIAEFRANAGYVETAGFKKSLVLLHSVGARSGEVRVNPVAAIAEDADNWLIAASYGGAPVNPSWYANLRAHPETEFEDGTDTIPVIAREVGDDEYEAAWGRFKARSSAFAGYEEKSGGRKIPVIRLTRRTPA
jgi:deazaflavin-dependent oxidoreductase (nitroreductase family)